MNLVKPAALCVLLLFLAVLPARTAVADIELSSVEWTTTGGLVEFHLVFYNPDPVNSSPPASGELWSQEFGAFLPDEGLICPFDIPEIPPESFFDVYCDIPLDELPPSAQEQHPWNPPEAPGVLAAAQNPCLDDNHWDGNVDISWSGPGGAGQVNYHLGTLNLCAGMGTSYIHVVTNCGNPASWVFTGVCSGFTAVLLNEDMTPAPNPVPLAWSGWMGVSASAGTAVGTICNFSLDFTCNNVTTPIHMVSEVCDCSTPVEPSTWGQIKSRYH